MADRLVDTSQLGALADDLERLGSLLHNEALLTRLGLQQIRAIKQRTRAGVAPDGSPFAPYSDAYARHRVAAGVPTKRDMLMYGVRYEAKGEGGEYVANAYDTMLDHLHEQVADDLQSVTLAFDRADKAALAAYHNEGEGNNPQREFAVVTAADLDALSKLVDGHIGDVLSIADLGT